MQALFDPGKLREIDSICTGKNLVILPHHKPDGDAMGASLALYNYFLPVASSVTVISPGDFPEFLEWMKGADQVLRSDADEGRAKNEIASADVIFCLDFNDPDRVQGLSNTLQSSRARKVVIDHHLEPKVFCDFTLCVPGASSTCELVYRFITESGHSQRVERNIAECLYAGIMTDTGSFRFSSMSSDAHRIIAALIDKGAVNHAIHERIFDNFSENRTRFLGHCIKDKLVVLPEYHTAYISVTMEELDTYTYRPGDTEGIVNYGLSIRGVRMAAFFSERDDMVKISFRSKGDFSVKDLAAAHFNGGGHMNAAGGRSRKSLDETVQAFINLLPRYKDALAS